MDGKAGQHQRGHDQQKRQQCEGLALFADGIQAGPFAQVHVTATSFPFCKTSGFTCVPPNVVFRRGVSRSGGVPSAGNTLMVHYEGGVEVELRYFLGGVGGRVQKSRGAFTWKTSRLDRGIFDFKILFSR